MCMLLNDVTNSSGVVWLKGQDSQECGGSLGRWFPLCDHRYTNMHAHTPKKGFTTVTRPAMSHLSLFCCFKMAVSNCPQGYLCEFIDPVSDDFYCKKCTLVARKLTFPSCCGESYCHACIADTLLQAKPCPACGVEKFETYPQIKFQQRIRDLQVYCSMKRRGCGLCGILEQLDTHLNPDLDNCQYVDTSCPLNCKQTLPKNKMEQHVAEECVHRDYGCQHCAFKATYEVVVDTHWPECVYLPLPCPNLCGVTCERGLMEDHMAMCRLQEVACEFTGVGCDRKLKREEQEEHTRQNTHKHLTITAAAAVKMKEQLLQKIEEQEQKNQQQLLKLDKQEKRIQQQELKLESTVEKLEQIIKLQEKKIEQLLKESDQNKVALEGVTEYVGLKRTFEMENFSKEKAKDKYEDWKSPAMYTHVCGYKFCIGIDANGYADGRGKALHVYLWAMPGEYDHQLQWPVEATLTLELLHQQRGHNVQHTITIRWGGPGGPGGLFILRAGGVFGDIPYGVLHSRFSGFLLYNYHFLEHSRLSNFLRNDTLYFRITKITI